MHTGTLTTSVNDKPSPTVNYLSAFNSTPTPSTGLYLTPKTEYPIINDVSNGSCYQTNLYSYNQNTFNNTTNCSKNSYDQAAINRRKNATRETTNTLKAWLYEHRKNPYPTKGEKIMLAIITKMTLTQVSTWFANARRRLKKENKMTWEPRNKCSNSGDEDDSSDIEYVSNENENDLNTSMLSENDDSRLNNKRSDTKLDQDDEMNGKIDETIRAKCEDSDSNTSSNLKQNSPSSYDNSNNYGKGDTTTTTNYSTTDSNYGNLENHHDRLFAYQRTIANEQIQFPYSASNHRATQYPHIAYSTAIQIPPVSTNLTYVQSQMNETSIYNQIHSHHYHNAHQTAHHGTPSNATVAISAAQTTQQISQTTNNLPNNLATGQQQSNQVESLQLQNQTAHSVYHHVPNLNAHHANYSLLQSNYPTDYMLAHHTHQLHPTTNNQQLNQNSLYYQPSTTTNLTQLTTQVQSTNVNLKNPTVAETNLYPNHHLPLVKSTPTNDSSLKSDENNNLNNNITNPSSVLEATSQMNAALENTRKQIWSLAQTATDSPSVMSSNVALKHKLPSNVNNSVTIIDNPTSGYIDPLISEQQSIQSNQQLVKDHSASTATIHNISSYMNGQLNNLATGQNYANHHSPSLDSSILTTTNNQLTNYNTLHHPNYSSIDCGQLAHNSSTILGKVFFEYFPTSTTGALEHDRNNWTRIGLI